MRDKSFKMRIKFSDLGGILVKASITTSIALFVIEHFLLSVVNDDVSIFLLKFDDIVSVFFLFFSIALLVSNFSSRHY